ncbi:MAG: hypothetical protein NC324_03015 [Bacteroides sp.]|nr:hypothetical protein [Bacteroides sp.]
MKKLAALLLIALAFCACSNNLNNDEKTASFSTIVDTAEDLENAMPEAWGQIEPIIYLVSDKTLEQINEYEKNHPICSWKSRVPVDSNYVYTPYDLIDLFRTEKVSAIQEDYAYSANYNDISYGEYALIHTFCIRHQDTLKLWAGFYTPITVNEQIDGRTVNRPLRFAMLNDGWHELGF